MDGLVDALIERLVEERRAIPQWTERTFCYELCIALEEIYDSATGRTPVDLGWLTERNAALLGESPQGG